MSDYYSRYYRKEEDLPKCKNLDLLIRGADGKCYEVTQMPFWGKAIVRVQDPHGVQLSSHDKNGIGLEEGFPRIPRELWQPWIRLCFDMVEDRKPKYSSGYGYGYSSYGSPDYEVQVILLRKEPDYKEWKLLVPQQIVSSGRVDADLTHSINLITGEVYEDFPLEGWAHAGTSHSHNTMSAFFSGTDDEYELKIPGMHVVVGKIDKAKNNYELVASVAMRGERKIVAPEEMIDLGITEGQSYNYHPDCLKFITKESYNSTSRYYASQGWVTTKKETKGKGKGKSETKALPYSSDADYESWNNQDWLDAWEAYDNGEDMDMPEGLAPQQLRPDFDEDEETRELPEGFQLVTEEDESESISDEILRQIADLVVEGKKIEAIKLFRQANGNKISLKKAKRFIEVVEEEVTADVDEEPQFVE